ncbi:hypothetical protein ABZ953_10465 [Streptomyces sp. NPDC046465]|uniref:hypothetical protein n=1 Tax=Streptomyces sp. NPDC046465 TaxID=3155810 RepID=UPI0033F9DDF2
MAALAFTSGLDAPAAVNLYLPLDPNLPHDEASLAAAEALMRDEGIDPAPHRLLIEKLCPTSLDRSHIQSWVSCQAAGPPRVTVYMGPELYPHRVRPSGGRQP